MRFPIRCLASVLLLVLLGHQVNSASVNAEQPSLLNLDLASFLKDDQVASSRQLPDSTDSVAEPKAEEDEATSRLDLALDTSDSKIIGVSAVDGTTNLLKAWQTSLNGIWDNIVEDYLSDVYTDVIEGYLIASIKLVGWFTFGTFLILKGAFLNSVYEQKQSGGSYGYGRTFSRSLTEELAGENGPQEIYFKLPYIEEWTGLKLVFPVDNSLQGCYKDRASCVARDFQGELDHLLTSFSDLWDFGQKWFGLYDKVEEMAVEGQL